MALKLRPSARLNRRYLLVEGKQSNIENSLLEYLGVLGWSKAAPDFLRGDKSRVIVVVNRKELTNVKAAIALSNEEVKILRVSGTIKGLRTNAKLKYDTE